jgi:hypothetical protein
VWHAPAEADVAVGRLQKVDDLGQLVLGLVDSSDVVERNADLLGVHTARLRTAKAAQCSSYTAARGRAPGQEVEQGYEQNRRAEPQQNFGQNGRLPGRLGIDLYALRLQQLRQCAVIPEDGHLRLEQVCRRRG